MKITKVFIQKGVTRNMGNYESIRLDVGLGAEVDEGENYVGVLQDLELEAKIQLDKLLNIELEAWGRGR